MDVLRELQEWYRSHCNGVWEHQCGISIDTLDNPGWIVTIDLAGTPLEGYVFTEISEGFGANGQIVGAEWITCYVRDRKFHGAGDPFRLEDILGIFLSWARGLL